MAIHRLGKAAKTLTPQFIAPSANPTGANWEDHTNKRVLVEGRGLPWTPKPGPKTILDPPVMQTPQSKSGTLIRDDGRSGLPPKSRKIAHQRRGRG